MTHQPLPLSMDDLSKETFAPDKPLIITRQEIIELMGDAPGTVDGFIRNQEGFPERISHGRYSRKAVMEFFKKKGLI